MFYLLISLALVACTPLIVSFVDRFQKLSQVFAFLLLATITYNIFAHIIVENIETFGFKVWIAFFLGLAIFSSGDHFFFANRRNGSLALIVPMHIFLFIHALTDGAALIETGQASLNHHDGQLSQSVILHRMIFEVFLWKFFRERFGQKAAVLVLLNVASGTITGFFMSQAVFSSVPSAFGLFEAFMGGALFHMVYDYLKERLFRGRSHSH